MFPDGFHKDFGDSLESSKRILAVPKAPQEFQMDFVGARRVSTVPESFQKGSGGSKKDPDGI